tara:strand:- start:197 stop:703 length:507 start_codon:yes stop_codon:yes gene_type:complete
MGFKQTSETIAVSFGLDEAIANTFIQEEIALQLDILNNEVFVVLAVDMDLETPDAIAGVNTSVTASLSTTSQTNLVSLADSNCLTNASEAIRAVGFVDSGVGFSRGATSTYIGEVDYIGIIATNNFFIQLRGGSNLGPKGVTGRMWGYRAKADSSTYAALVQSEVLSA